ncbi:serine/threonine-protein kinase RsbW [Streptosporangium becharense]|uniref:Serine/threonine-protein kinase RsbW n=1 Tax=Streptosporangium becharense TaxID=1816182 RepID=A0A7W9IC42_9ACTN|nr:ATP-binding protein [Streptosporangium becharense]MBB2913600.1 serine/threonine-protein kinase RsbW [Streptosporangium becharense]MBB5817681.1 serine/threonine-protein kinase RsbW [Streptosporangium becharense]
MEATIALRLPRDAASVPVIRQLLDSSLRTLGVEPRIREDIQLMLSEACSNVIKHATPSDDYMVSTELARDKCVIKVVDAGDGFDFTGTASAAPTAEHGRGLQIMRALADDIRFTSRPEHGSVVCLEKFLRFVDDAPGLSLLLNEELQLQQGVPEMVGDRPYVGDHLPAGDHADVK